VARTTLRNLRSGRANGDRSTESRTLAVKRAQPQKPSQLERSDRNLAMRSGLCSSKKKFYSDNVVAMAIVNGIMLKA
jgi:hypothetical protein